jgi:pectinesterase
MNYLTALLVALSPLHAGVDATVSADGGATFRTVQEAINAVPQNTSADKPWTILVKPGRYNEVVYIQQEKRFVRLVGEDPAETVITHHLHAKLTGPDGKEIGTFRTATVQVDANDFIFENLTFENSAGPVAQALAIRIDGDRVAFRNCNFLGFQDTVLTNRGRHYFENCSITGAVDFIFGGATAFFEKCNIRLTRDGYITAASTPAEQAHGLVFSNCAIVAEKPGIKMYLGRPWRPHSHTVFLNTTMDGSIRPEGWHNWGKPESETTARYGEFRSKGPGGKPEKRVAWARQLSEEEASGLTVSAVLGGSDGWVPFKPNSE